MAALASSPLALALQLSNCSKDFLLLSPNGRSLHKEDEGDSSRAEVRH